MNTVNTSKTMEEIADDILEQYLQNWERTLPGTPENEATWSFVEGAIKTFKHCQQAWERTLHGSSKRKEIWKLAREKAGTHIDFLWVMKRTYFEIDKAEAWEVTKEGNFEEYMEIFKQMSPSLDEEFLKLAKESIEGTTV